MKFKKKKDKLQDEKVKLAKINNRSIGIVNYYHFKLFFYKSLFFLFIKKYLYL